MLRSNLSARADARAWAAMLVSLLILALHAWAKNAINLLDLQIRISPTWETPWLPHVKIFRVDDFVIANPGVVFDDTPATTIRRFQRRTPRTLGAAG